MNDLKGKAWFRPLDKIFVPKWEWKEKLRLRMTQGIRLDQASVLTADFYFGCRVWAIMTCRLKFSTMFSARRTSVGFLARVI
jgi:hypothetical protein